MGTEPASKRNRGDVAVEELETLLEEEDESKDFDMQKYIKLMSTGIVSMQRKLKKLDVLDSLTRKVENLETKNASLEKANEQLTEKVQQLSEEMLKIRADMSRDSLILVGLQQQENEPESVTELKVNKLIKDDLGLNFTCKKAVRLKGQAKEGEPYLIKASFDSSETAVQILRAKKKSPKGVFINPDLPQELRKIRKRLIKNASRLSKEGKQCKIDWKSLELSVDGQKTHWSKLQEED